VNSIPVVATLIAWVIPAMNFILLVAVGLELTSGDFARVRRQRGLLLLGLLAPLLVLPALALALIRLLRPEAAVAGSLLLIAACPIGGISNTFSYLARASTALSVTLTGLSCIAAAVTMPMLGKLFAARLDTPFGLSAPIGTLVGQLAFVLAVPVTLGMWVRHRRPDLAQRGGPAMRRLSLAGTALVLGLIVASAPSAFVSGLAATVPLAGAFVAASVATGWATGALATSDPRDRFTMAAQFGSRNIGIAMTMAVTVLGQVAFAQFAVIYALTEIPLLLAAIALFRRRQRQHGAAGRSDVAAAG
jgi:BASS family bile acid:Na+ symporter